MIIQGDCLEVLKSYPDNHFTSVITDPPYGLHFMGKTWDDFKKTNFDERGDYKHLEGNGTELNRERGHENKHPTVKPLALMKYLINLIMPPKDGLILDPFAGSGTTILAAKNLGYDAIGIEKEQEYCEIANKRLEAVND